MVIFREKLAAESADESGLLQGLPPRIHAGARVLILGSMPGAASLDAANYYAHPRNLFWPFMGELFGAGPKLDYDARFARLHKHDIAVWDVIGRCRRQGSLDSAIEPASIEVNDFPSLFANYPTLRHIVFNGQKAAQAFKRHAISPPDIALHRLPSTSPANASMARDKKMDQWRQLTEWVKSR